MLALERLCVVRSGFHAISDLSVDLEAGWVGVVGANGSGKTSLLRAIAGRLPHSSGTIRVNNVCRTADRAWRAHHMGFAPEAGLLPSELSGREIFDIIGRGSWDDGLRGALAPLRNALGLSAFIDRRIGSLSSGLRQRLAIYAAFIGRPALVLLDEPFNWLDPLTAYDLKQVLRKFAADGMLVITALHELSTLASMCDRGLLLADGRLAADLQQGDLADASRDIRAFEARIVQRFRSSR